MSVNVDTTSDNVLLLVNGTYTPVTGFRLNWVVSDPSSVLGNPTLALDTIQNIIIPNGAFTADQDIVYFTHDSRSGIAIIKRQDNSPDDVHIDSLAVILPDSTSLSPVHTWHYISDLKHILSTQTDVEIRRQAAISWYSTNVVRKRGRSVRVFDPKKVTWEEQLADSSYHPLHNLPLFLRIFGPSFVTVYKYVLARHRVVIYLPPGASNNIPSQENHKAKDDISDRPAESEDPTSNSGKATDTAPLLTRPCELASGLAHIFSALCGGKDRPCALGFLDGSRPHNALFDDSLDSSSGWIACTSEERFLLSHLHEIDLVVDLSPIYNSSSLMETETSTATATSEGIKAPLLLVPSFSSSTPSTTLASSLQLRPTRFTLLDIQLWSDIQGVMKRIERAKQRELRRPIMNGSKSMKGRNGSLQERASISDSDWDDGDFAVPGGWNLPNVNGNTLHTEDSSAEQDQGVPASSDLMTTQEVIHPSLQPPPLPQKLTYTLDLITAFHRHVVSLSKSYATMATTNSSHHLPSSSSSSTSANAQSPRLPHIEFDDLERLFLEGGRRRRGNLLNGILEPPSAVHGLPSNLVARNTSTSAAINGKEINGNTAVDNLSGTTISTASISSSTISPSSKRISMQSDRRSPTPTPSSFSKVASNTLRSLSRSPLRSHPSSKRSRSRSSSRESERTALVFVDAAQVQVQVNVNHDTSQSHQPPDLRISPTPSSPPGSYSPPPYPYVYSSSYPRRPDTATSFSSIPTSQFMTPEHSPMLTARNSPINTGIGSLDGTPKVTGMKITHDRDVELLVLDTPEPVLPPASFAPSKEKAEVEEGLGKENGQKKEVILNGEGDKITHDNDEDGFRNSVSFPSSISAPPAMPPTQLISPNTSKKSFSRKRSYSDDVSHNPPQLPVPGIVSGRESPSKPTTASSPSLLKKEKHLSGTLPTDSQLLEVEAELREQEARMLAPSPTPPALASPVLGPRKVKGWSVPTSIFLGKREKDELAESEDSDVKVTQVPTEEQKGDMVDNAGEKEREGGVDRNLVLTPVEVLWERRREGSASPSKDIAALTSSVPPAPPPTPLPNSAPTMATLPPYLFSPQPLPPGAAAPSPNVGPVITSIIDALRGAIALNGSSPSPDATNGNVHTYDRDSPPLTPPPPLLSAYSNSSSSPARTPTPQSLSGRETPRGLPKIDEEEEEESVNGDGYEDRKRVSLLRHRPPLMQGQGGHATDSGDADAEGPDDGETGSMASSTAAGSVSLSPNPPGLGLGADETRSSPSLILPSPLPSPGFLSTTTTTASTAVSATSIPLSPSPHPFAPSPSPSPSPSGLTISPPSPLKPKPAASNTSTPNSSPQKTIKSPPVSKKSAAAVRGHATSSSMSNPSSASSSSSSSLISNLTKSLSLKIRPRRLSLLSSSSKKGDDGTAIKDGVTTATDEEEKKNEVMNRKSRSVPNTIGSSTGSMSSSPSMSSSIGSNTTSPTSLSLSNSTSPSTSFSSVNSGNNNIWIKSPRIRARATTSSGLPSSPSSSSKEPVFNMVTLMSAEDGSIEEWNGRNSGVGTLALANEMKRAQEESKLKGGVNSVVVVGGGGGESDDVVNWSPLENAAIESDTPAAQVSPVVGLSSSKLAPTPKKGILRIRRASLTSLPPSEPARTIAESSSGRNSSMSVSSSVKLGDGKQHPSPTSTPPRDQKKSKSTPTLKPKSMFTEVIHAPADNKEDSSIRLRRDSLGLIRKGKGLINVSTPPPPPVPSLPNSSESTTTNVESGIQSPVIMVRSNTPDSTRRKLRKRRKSLVEPLAATTTDV